MRRWQIVLSLTFFLAALLVLGIAIFMRHREPRFQGRALSEWLEVYGNSGVPDERNEAKAAVLAIGTNAIPFLIKNLKADTSPLEWKLYKNLPASIQRNKTFNGYFFGMYDKVERGQWGFMILGSNANSAVPELTKMMNCTNALRRSESAIAVLSTVGVAAFPVLKNAFEDKSRPCRNEILSSIGSLARNGFVDTNTVMPVLQNGLEDANAKVKETAEWWLNFFRQDATTNHSDWILETK